MSETNFLALFSLGGEKSSTKTNLVSWLRSKSFLPCSHGRSCTWWKENSFSVQGEGRKSRRQFPKHHLTSSLCTARQEDPVLGGHPGGWRFATTGDHGQALLPPTIQTAECQNCRDVSQCTLQRGWLAGKSKQVSIHCWAEGWDKWEESFVGRQTGLLDDEQRGSPVT